MGERGGKRRGGEGGRLRSRSGNRGLRSVQLQHERGVLRLDERCELLQLGGLYEELLLWVRERGREGENEE